MEVGTRGTTIRRMAPALLVLVGCWHGGSASSQSKPDAFAVRCASDTQVRSQSRPQQQTLSWCVDEKNKRHGRSQLVDKDGRIVSEEEYDHGKLVSRLVYDARDPNIATWSAQTEKDGAVRVKGTRRFGKLDGTVVYLDDQDRTLFTDEYRDGSLVTVPEQLLVRRAYTGIQRVLADKAYERLPALVDRATIDTYDSLRHDALWASRAEVQRKPVVDRILILSMRYRLGQQLHQMTGRDVLAEGVEPPVALFTVLQQTDLDNVTISGANAVVTTKFRGKRSFWSAFHFHKEGDQWKLDLLTLTRDLEPYMTTWFRVATDADIEAYVAGTSGLKPGPQIWQPLGPPTP